MSGDPSKPPAQPPGAPASPHPQGPYPGYTPALPGPEGYTPSPPQGGPGYAPPPAGGQGYTPPPPGPPGYVPPPPGPQGYVPPPPPRRRAGWATGLVALVVVIALVGGAYFLFRNQLSGNVGSLQVGDCIDVPSGSDSVTDLQHHPCTDPHDAEVFALINDPTDGDYPGVDHFQTLANVACVAAAVQYLGVDLSARNDLSGGFFYPTTDGWTNNDDRTIDCYLDRTDGGKLTVPLKGIGASPLP